MPAEDRAHFLALAARAAETVALASQAWANLTPSLALEATWRLIRETNAHLETHEPWKMPPGPALDAVMGDALEVLRITAVMASPALTRASVSLWHAIGLDGSPADQRLPEAAVWGGYPGGAHLERGPALFPRIETAE